MKNIKDYLAYSRITLFALALIAWGLILTSSPVSSRAGAIQAREIRVVSATASPGQNVTVSIELISLGDENAIGFSLNFNPAILSSPTVTIGSGATGATSNFNISEVGSGRLGIAVAFGAGGTFDAGARQLVSVRFAVAASAPLGPTPITFGDEPVVSEVSDAVASALLAIYTPGAVNVAQPNPVPMLIGLSPNSAAAGGPGFTLIANGSNFVDGSVVRWNGSPRNTTFFNSTRVIALISATDIATQGTATVTVFNPGPGGGTSTGVTFSIVQPNPNPGIASLNPTFAMVGGQSFTLTVNGTDFTNSSVVRWDGGNRPTTFVSATQLRAAISETDIATAGTAQVSVFTSAPGGGTTSALPFIIAARVSNVSAASFLGAELAAESIIAAFGGGLATRTESAARQPLPTDLAGTKVMVRDSVGTERLAPQFFVSGVQANYQMPPGTANGAATVMVTSGAGLVSIGTTQVARVVPGVFTANANGQGVAAAIIVRVKPDGSQTTEPVARLDSATGRFVSVPIDLGPATDQVFLVVFGTGFRFRSALSTVSARLGGVESEVLYAGVTPGFVGLDQCNIRISRSLIGRGEIDVVLTVDTKTANTSRLNIR